MLTNIANTTAHNPIAFHEKSALVAAGRAAQAEQHNHIIDVYQAQRSDAPSRRPRVEQRTLLNTHHALRLTSNALIVTGTAQSLASLARADPYARAAMGGAFLACGLLAQAGAFGALSEAARCPRGSRVSSTLTQVTCNLFAMAAVLSSVGFGLRWAASLVEGMRHKDGEHVALPEQNKLMTGANVVALVLLTANCILQAELAGTIARRAKRQVRHQSHVFGA